ncbi:hypothetical protein D3C80_2106740 [compost metagenome]
MLTTATAINRINATRPPTIRPAVESELIRAKAKTASTEPTASMTRVRTIVHAR